MSTRDHIVQQVMLNEFLLKRKATLDQLLDGLCALSFKHYSRVILKIFSTFFVHHVLWNWQGHANTVRGGLACSIFFSSIGCKNFLHFHTGSRLLPPTGFGHPEIEVMFTTSSSEPAAYMPVPVFHTLKVPHFSTYSLLQPCFDAVITGNDFNTL